MSKREQGCVRKGEREREEENVSKITIKVVTARESGGKTKEQREKEKQRKSVCERVRKRAHQRLQTKPNNNGAFRFWSK